jgi:hypothetical protein
MLVAANPRRPAKTAAGKTAAATGGDDARRRGRLLRRAAAPGCRSARSVAAAVP